MIMTDTKNSQESGEIRQLPRTLYLDSQFVIAYLVANDKDHKAAQRRSQWMEQLSSGGMVEVFVSVLVIDEVSWRLSGILYDKKHGPGQWRSLKHPAKKQAFMGFRSEIADAVEGFLQKPWIDIASLGEGECRSIPQLMRDYELLSADLCHLACAVCNSIGGILTNDQDFHNIPTPPVEILSYKTNS